jgi:hypothetical protein
VKTLGVRRWRKRAEDREDWVTIFEEVTVKLEKVYAKEEDEEEAC